MTIDGFQHLSTMAGEQDIYADLARRGVTVHTDGIPDAPAPAIGDGTVHPSKQRR